MQVYQWGKLKSMEVKKEITWNDTVGSFPATVIHVRIWRDSPAEFIVLQKPFVWINASLPRRTMVFSVARQWVLVGYLVSDFPFHFYIQAASRRQHCGCNIGRKWETHQWHHYSDVAVMSTNIFPVGWQTARFPVSSQKQYSRNYKKIIERSLFNVLSEIR